SRRADGDWHHANGRLCSSHLSTGLHDLSDCCPDHHAPAEDRRVISGGREIAKGHKGQMGPKGLKTERTLASIEKASKRGIIGIGSSLLWGVLIPCRDFPPRFRRSAGPGGDRAGSHFLPASSSGSPEHGEIHFAPDGRSFVVDSGVPPHSTEPRECIRVF